jgi:hypothetical protein
MSQKFTQRVPSREATEASQGNYRRGFRAVIWARRVIIENMCRVPGPDRAHLATKRAGVNSTSAGGPTVHALGARTSRHVDENDKHDQNQI